MIRVENLAIKLGAFALSGIGFVVPKGQYGVLMGKTGSGKTTLLEAICGLKPLLRGQIHLHEREVTNLAPALRGVGYVPQDGALFANMTVAEHLGFALAIRKWDAASIRKRVAELAGMLGLEKLLARKPLGLSGGEKQRVALGRALSFRPPILCLDEPLSSLDEDTREEMVALLKSLCKHGGITTLHVTHSLSEAQTLADLLLRLQDGKIVDTIYE